MRAESRVWHTLGASATGPAHAALGLPCQDAFAWAEAGGALILAVSDGAGSAEFAAQASRLQADAAAAWCAEHLEALNGLALTGYLQTQLMAAAGETPLRQWAATLTVLVLWQRRVWCFSVGDSAAVLQSGGEWWPVFWPLGGGYANETHFVYDAGPRTMQEVWLDVKVSGAALFSDGLHTVALQHAAQTAHGPFFAPLLELLRTGRLSQGSLAQFLSSPRLQERSDDDKTLLLAVRR